MPTLSEEFAEFWRVFPRKVGKLVAQKAYQKARKVASAAEILDGVARYAEHKPSYADYCHPSTFLSQGRWLDEYDAPVVQRRTYWFDECQAIHGGTCDKQWNHDMKVRAEKEATR